MPRSLRSAAGALRALLLCGALLTAGCEAGPPAPEKADEAPLDVVLITIDTLRADALGTYGQERPTSPTLDALAAEGVLFEQCTTSVPSTLPSHASIMTGKQPYSHGARDNEGYVLAAENVTLAEHLKKHGYRTAAEVAAPVIGRRTLLSQGFDQYRDLVSFDIERLQVDVEGETKTLHERGASDITKHGLQFLSTAGDQPFFLWLHYFDPHVFYAAPDIYGQLVGNSPYHAEVRYVDSQIERVIAWLKRSGRAERTLVVITSDHGEGLGEHEELTHSYFVYDTTMHVPLIFWGPGLLKKPHRVGSLVRTVDIAPTIVDLLGLPPLEDIEGTSLTPLIEGRESSLDLVGYGESMRTLMTFGTSMLRFVRKGSWKYIHKVSPELYDVSEDPGERNNLADQHPERVAELRARLRDLMEAAPESAPDAFRAVDDTTQAHLQALGYVATSIRPETDEVNSLEVSGVDPSALGADILNLSRAHGFQKAGLLDKAESLFRELLDRYPRSIAPLTGLIGTLRQKGETDELPSLLRRGIEAGTTRADYFADLAGFTAEAGDVEEAERLIRQGLELQPCSVFSWVRLSNILKRAGEYRRQLAVLEQAVASCPDLADLKNDLAYALATTPLDDLRDGARALELAREAIAKWPENPSYLDTLACALAETGDRGEAQKAASRAITLLEARGFSEEVISEFRNHLVAFQSGESVRD
jgi:arylsulfatase A-like enzyme/Flp pilus assembly protein TadD